MGDTPFFWKNGMYVGTMVPEIDEHAYRAACELRLL